MSTNITHSIFVFLLSSFLFGPTLSAQEVNREFGIRLTDFDSFGAIYKRQLVSGNWVRYRVAAGRISYASVTQIRTFNFNGALSVGWEKRNSINDRLQFLHGFEPSVGLAFQSVNDGRSLLDINLGLGYVLGLQYALSPTFLISVEAIPSFDIGWDITDGSPNRLSTGVGFSAERVAVAAVYRFSSRAKGQRAVGEGEE